MGLKTSSKLFFGLALLMAVLYLVFQLRPASPLEVNFANSSLSTQPAFQAYPFQEENIYPGQTEMPVNLYPMPEESPAADKMSICANLGTWVEYVNEKAGFSFQYPAEAEIHESVDLDGYPSVVLGLRPGCYVTHWWGPLQMGIGTLTNPDKLSLEEFVVKRYISDASSDPLVVSRKLAEVSSNIAVDKAPTLLINGAITRETPKAYILHDSLIIYVGLENTSHMPPFEQACPTTLDLYNKILSSIKLLNR